ncbi:MAG TPA: hypothetical protein VHW23_19360 [Kofleriaceae bacterium]|nr:hypothetical protein [Kofleriaceae bacterium]
MPAPGQVNGSSDDWGPAPSVGETQVFFNSYRSGPAAKLWFSTRAAKTDPFGAAAPVTPTDVQGAEQICPTLTEDGLELIYADNQLKGYKLYVSRRASTTAVFPAGTELAIVNDPSTTVDDSYPFVSADGLDLVWSSTRARGVEQLWEARRSDRAANFGTPHQLVSDNASDRSPSLSPDRLDIYFSSTRTGGPGGFDIFVAHRPALDQPFGPATLIPELSSSLDDMAPRLTPDGATMYLDYNALTTGAKGGINADIDIATRTRTCQ